MTRGNLRRRRFLQAGAAAALAGPTISCSGNRSPWRFFTPAEARTVEAICDQLIPADQDPGAAWAGVVRYIDRQLLGFFKPMQKAYREGLAALDGFADMPAEKKAASLAALEKDRQKPGKIFFDMILAHTMQGFYGSPRHGGNRDAVSWRMLGVPEPPVRGRRHYDLRKG
jgi:gluconate 2-dehydrogenase gamma chain